MTPRCLALVSRSCQDRPRPAARRRAAPSVCPQSPLLSMSSSPSSSASVVSSLVQTFLRANNPARLSGWMLLEKAAALGFILYGLQRLRKIKLDDVIKAVPGAAGALSSTIDSETRAAVATMFPSELIQSQTLSIPATGRAYSDILAEMAQWRTFDPKRGRVFGYMYESCDPQYEHFIESAFVMYMHENGLNPTAFPALRKLEVEVVAMTLDMFHAPPSAVGTMTSGGTESLLLTIKSYRDRARALHPHITKPEAVMCHSVHVAVPKACAYFDVQPVFIDMDPQTMQADVDKMRAAITNNTILLLASAPQYPHGIVDPVVEIGRLAVERKLPLHVDACMGGFLLPWVEKLGFPVPQFDFRVAGVTSISADIHKYGYAAKGASTLSWISQEYRQYQFFAFAQWPGGMFVSPSMLGTRPGGAIAAAYAALVGNGQSGYLARAKVLMECSKQLQRALAAVPEVRVLGEPHMSIVAWTTKKEFEKEINLFAVADVMEKQFNFKVECQQHPVCLHVTLTPPHIGLIDSLVQALVDSIAYVRAHPECVREGSAATYGLVAKIPSDAVVDQFLVAYMDKVLRPSSAATTTGDDAEGGTKTTNK